MTTKIKTAKKLRKSKKLVPYAGAETAADKSWTEAPGATDQAETKTAVAAARTIDLVGTLLSQSQKYLEVKVGDVKAWCLKSSLIAHEIDGDTVAFTIPTRLAKRKGFATE